MRVDRGRPEIWLDTFLDISIKLFVLFDIEQMVLCKSKSSANIVRLPPFSLRTVRPSMCTRKSNGPKTEP